MGAPVALVALHRQWSTPDRALRFGKVARRGDPDLFTSVRQPFPHELWASCASVKRPFDASRDRYISSPPQVLLKTVWGSGMSPGQAGGLEHPGFGGVKIREWQSPCLRGPDDRLLTAAPRLCRVSRPVGKGAEGSMVLASCYVWPICNDSGDLPQQFLISMARTLP